MKQILAGGYIIELEPGVWRASWRGDPGRCVIKSHAKRYQTFEEANRALTRSRKWRPFVNAKIYHANEVGLT